MLCPKCGLKIPDDSAFCVYCGAKIEAISGDSSDGSPASAGVMPNEPEHSTTSFSKESGIRGQKLCKGCGSPVEEGSKRCKTCGKRYSKSALRIVACIVLAVLVLGAGFCGYNYYRFTTALDNGQFAEANRYLRLIPFGSSVFKAQSEFLDACRLIENGEYVSAYVALISIRGYHVPASVMEHVQERIYAMGKSAYRNGAFSDANNYFSHIITFKRSNDYLTLIGYCGDSFAAWQKAKYHYSELYDLAKDGFENAGEVLLMRSSSANQFLKGRWEGGSRNNAYFFEITDSGESLQSNTNLPHKDVSGSFSISDSIYYTISGNESDSIKQFRFSIINEDAVSVYCYKDGSTYTLYRQ